MTKKPGYVECKGPEWDRQRMRAMVRDDFHCRAHELDLCKEPCTENRPHYLIVHHIRMRKHGGTHDLDNLMTLCRAHHEQLHPWMKMQLPMRDMELPAGDDMTLPPIPLKEL
jgi:hypothetical protein